GMQYEAEAGSCEEWLKPPSARRRRLPRAANCANTKAIIVADSLVGDAQRKGLEKLLPGAVADAENHLALGRSIGGRHLPLQPAIPRQLHARRPGLQAVTKAALLLRTDPDPVAIHVASLRRKRRLGGQEQVIETRSPQGLVHVEAVQDQPVV